MVEFKVRAIYDFNAEPNTGELSITYGEILTVYNVNVGEGWWEGKNTSNISGLFPIAYVERISNINNEVPPPNLPPPPAPFPIPQDDDWDDEWDNEDTYSEIGPTAPPPQQQQHQQSETNYMNTEMIQQRMRRSSNEPSDSNVNTGPVKRGGFNRFSTYGIKTSLDTYLLGGGSGVSAQNRVRIRRDDSSQCHVTWEPMTPSYSVQVTSPKKSSKMGGLKSFIAYQLTPSFTGIEVSRRYKHFDWLHNRLTEKFHIVAIPPLPDKQISGRYEEHFVEHRRVQLQEFVDYMCRHPVLSKSDVWHHFLTCTDEKQWKQGKRNAERDQLVGANFCLCIDAPDKDLLASTVDNLLSMRTQYMLQMEQSIKNLLHTTIDQQKKCTTLYKREFSRIGECFFGLGAAYEMSEGGMFTEFSLDVKNIGTAYASIAKLYSDQGKFDWQPLADKLYLYRGVTGCFSDMFTLQKNAEQKKKEIERNGSTGSSTTSSGGNSSGGGGGQQVAQIQIGEVRRRTDILTYALLAELNHFQQQEMHNGFKMTLKSFLQEQLNFYRNIVVKLEDTLNRF